MNLLVSRYPGPADKRLLRTAYGLYIGLPSWWSTTMFGPALSLLQSQVRGFTLAHVPEEQFACMAGILRAGILGEYLVFDND